MISPAMLRLAARGGAASAFAAGLFALATHGALAADDPCTSLSNVVTRPTVTNSVCVVEPGHVLLETGYSNTTADGGGGNTVLYPQAQLRVATSVKHLEADLVIPSIERIPGARGVSDVGGGLKYLFGYSPRMQYGAQLSLTAPTGDDAFTAGASQTTLALNGSYALSPVFSLTSSQNIARLATGGVRYTSYIPTLTLSASLPHATTLFGEAALFTNALGPQTGTRTQYIAGVSRDLGTRVQLDLEDIYSATTSTGKYNGVGVGFSYLF